MKLLTPLGLLGLLGVVALIIIYLIRPNYQQKSISSTYIWKLSLKYKKKRVPISKLRNILIIICQILALVACALILAQPNEVLKAQADYVEVIAIIDSSASMRAETNGETRFERAVDEARVKGDDVLKDGGVVSVIIADAKPHFLLERVNSQGLTIFDNTMDDIYFDEAACSYGTSDVDGAMALCESVLSENPAAEVWLYTDMLYSNVPPRVNVVNVADADEWNAAILNARAVLEDNNYYAFYIDVAVYGAEKHITVNMDVQGVNASDSTSAGLTYQFSTTVTCTRDNTKTVVFKYLADGEEQPKQTENTEYIFIKEAQKVYSYQSVHISLDLGTESDSFINDNSFEIFGGQKEVLKIQYTSSSANTFFNAAFFVLQANLKDRWDIQLTEVKDGNYALSGFDLYLFEHIMPERMPEDGVVWLVDPIEGSPIGAGFGVTGVYNFGKPVSLSAGEEHAITNNIRPDKITVSRYCVISQRDSAYKVLMSVDNKPALMVKETSDAKVVVMAFSVHYSDYVIRYDFQLMVNNIFRYFFPTTVSGNSFEVGSAISLNGRGQQLSVWYNNKELETLTKLPGTFSANVPGMYQIKQTTDFEKDITTDIYVKIPSTESNIKDSRNSMVNPYKIEDENDYYYDLLIYIAAALVAFLFIEWVLHIKEEA